MRILLFTLSLFSFTCFAEVLNYIQIDPINCASSSGILVDLTKSKLLFVSEQFPTDPLSGEKKEGSIEEATYQTLENIQRVLKEVGSNFSYIVHMDIVLNNMKDLAGMNEAYADFFSRLPFPARKVIQSPIPTRIAISCLALVPNPPRCLDCEKSTP